jgi:ComF family protein
VCPGCAGEFQRLSGLLCQQCATPLLHGRRCGACLAAPPRFDRLIAPFTYTFPVDALIHALKYGRRLIASRPLAAALAAAVDERVDMIIPMPLAAARLRERGFNQAQEIARHVGRATGIAVAIDVCRRVLDTPPQALLPWKARAKNVRGAFVCDRDLHGMHIAVVDDVVTTGATLNEMARILKRAGAIRVSGWSVARALRHAVTPGPTD